MTGKPELVTIVTIMTIMTAFFFPAARRLRAGWPEKLLPWLTVLMIASDR
jgi:hypothetical protein